LWRENRKNILKLGKDVWVKLLARKKKTFQAIATFKEAII
jgi:hypothetical protein